MDYYSRHASELTDRYESVRFEDVHESWLQFLPETRGLVLDVGAGSGRDAAWFAARGHEVVAIEPSDVMREKAQTLHTSPSIQWVRDSLPGLSEVHKLGFKFNLILLSAMWMHGAYPVRIAGTSIKL